MQAGFSCMEMHQVRYFLAVCETLNFTLAAEQCNVAQPSLTRAIQKLEDEMGGLLLRRERNRTHLTELGKLVRPHLEQIFAANHSAREQAKGYREQKTAPLTLGVMCTIGPSRLIGFFNHLAEQIPALQVATQEATGGELVEELMQGNLEIAIIGLPEFPDRLDARSLFSERYAVAFAEGHRFEAMDEVPVMELDQEDYLVRINCEYPDHFDALGVPNSCEVNVRYQSEREDWIQAMILAGLGCSVMAESMPMLPGVQARPICDPEVTRTISVVTVSGRRYTPTVRSLIQLTETHDWTGG